MEKLTIVVLGATGFVGRALLEQLSMKADRFDVHAQVRPGSGLPAYANLHCVTGDLDAIHPALFPQKPHVLVHFGVKNIDHDGTGFWHTNVRGTENLLAHCNAHTRGIIYGSTLSVHGQGPQRNILPGVAARPETPLAQSRAAAEQRIIDFARANDRFAYCLRPRFILGADDRFVLPGLQKLAGNGIFIGDGRQRYSVIHVDDYAALILRLSERILSGASVEQMALNVGYQEPLSFADIFATLRSGLPAPRPRRKIPVPVWLPRLIKRIPIQSVFDKATQLELIGFDHYGDVTATLQRVGADLLKKPASEILAAVVTQMRNASQRDTP